METLEVKNLKRCLDRLKMLADKIAPEKLNKNNWLNLQLSKLQGDILNLQVIVSRLKNDREVEETSVDIKSIYLFSKVFADDFIYLIAKFIEKVCIVSIGKIDIKNLGNFIRDMNNSRQEQNIFQKFWVYAEASFTELHRLLEYRSYISHIRESTTEWTMQYRPIDMYENAYLENLPWAGSTTKSSKTTTPQTFLFEIDGLYTSIINCLEIVLNIDNKNLYEMV